MCVCAYLWVCVCSRAYTFARTRVFAGLFLYLSSFMYLGKHACQITGTCERHTSLDICAIRICAHNFSQFSSPKRGTRYCRALLRSNASETISLWRPRRDVQALLDMWLQGLAQFGYTRDEHMSTILTSICGHQISDTRMPRTVKVQRKQKHPIVTSTARPAGFVGRVGVCFAQFGHNRGQHMSTTRIANCGHRISDTRMPRTVKVQCSR